MTFEKLGVIAPILKSLEDKGYTSPTAIQEQAIPILLEGKDLLGCAQTGTGKTAAFAIPILQNLHNSTLQKGRNRKIKALIVTPTRELAIQIGDSFTVYGKNLGLNNTVVFGGVKQASQVRALKNGIDILVATPGRLLDLMGQGFISLKDVKFSVLDEADHMLDMGFIHDIKKIILKLPKNRQSLFFSATMPPDIVKLSQKILGNPIKITIEPEKATAEKVEQQLYKIAKKSKTKLLIHLINSGDIQSAIVFTRTKHGANNVVKKLDKAGILSSAIHGNKSQNARQQALQKFKDGEIKVLCATDIAARGIDVDDLSHVINFDLPNVPETYVHRIGRTGRAKASGIAISFCSPDERDDLRSIERLIGNKVPLVEDHPYVDDIDEKSTEDKTGNGGFKHRGKSIKPKQNNRRRFSAKPNSGRSSNSRG